MFNAKAYYCYDAENNNKSLCDYICMLALLQYLMSERRNKLKPKLSTNWRGKKGYLDEGFTDLNLFKRKILVDLFFLAPKRKFHCSNFFFLLELWSSSAIEKLILGGFWMLILNRVNMIRILDCYTIR